MRSRTRIALAACLLAPAATAHAEPALRLSAAEVRSGEVVAIEWSGLPRGVEEVELELSLDGGRWVRISPELDGREARFEWRSPEGMAGSARVRLRCGRRHEEQAGPEATLRIVSEAAHTPGDARVQPEWWRVAERGAGSRPGSFESAEASLSPARMPAVAVPATGDGAGPVRTRARDARAQVGRVAAPALAPRTFAAPTRPPLRN